MSNYVITEILKSRKVTEYLAQKGHQPIGTITNGKLRYRCPLPHHKADNTPSFIVYMNGEFENYFCYGCKASYHIIHLYRDLEGVSTKEAIKALSNGLDLDVDAEIAHAVREITQDRSHEMNIVEASLMLNRRLYKFLKEVNFESSCAEVADKMFTAIDDAVGKGDVRQLLDMDEPLSDAVMHKIRWYREVEEQRILDLANDDKSV